ncbi:MAG: hypothetical protein ABSD32_16210 [Mycobacterium sp.]
MSRQTALIAQDSASQRKEFIGAADQSIDGLNGFAPNVDISLKARFAQAARQQNPSANVPEGGG